MEFKQICRIDSPATPAAVSALQSQKSSVASSDHTSTSSNGDSGYHSDHGGYHHGAESSEANIGKTVCSADENECLASLSNQDSKSELHFETISTSDFVSKFVGQDSNFECERTVCMSGTDVNANHKCSTQTKQCDVELVPHQNEMNSCPSCVNLHSNTTAAVNLSQNDVEDDFNCATVPSHFPSKSSESSQISDNAISTAVQELALNIEFCLMFGYKPSQIKTAVTKLSYKASKNDILMQLSSMVPSMEDSLSEKFGEYISHGADRSRGSRGLQSRGPLSIENENKDNHTVEDSENLRPIVIDGSNVAMSHGNKQYFSCQGILLAVDYFRSRNHRDITVFVPTYRKEAPRSDAPIRDRQILDKLEEERILVYTPSRYISGKRVTCYDDRFILRLAEETDGVIVSNDNFRDLQSEKPEWKELVEKRLLMYSFASDRFMVPDDPLGRNGPNIDNFLRIRPISEEQNKPQCPYGKKCTYGKKCKYFHPECARPVSERMKEKSEKRTKASSQCIELAMELIKTSDWGNEPPPLHTENNHGQEFKSVSSSWKMDSNGRQRRITNGIHDDEPNYLPSNKIQSSYENHFGTAHNNIPYTNSCSKLPDAFRQLSVTNQFPMNHNASMPCGHSSNQVCYDTHSLKYQQMNEQPVHINFPNVPYVREGGPPDFHMENHPQLKSSVLNQQYQRSSPANLQIYDRNNSANSVLQRQHMNLPSPYQSVPGLQSPYGIPPQPVYTQGYRDSPFQTNPAMVCYNVAGRQGSTGVHPSMLPPNSYYANSSRSNSSLSHSYPFVSPDKAVISSSYSQHSVGNSSTGSESKTFPPRAPRVYSSPAAQHQHLLQQSPYSNNQSYAAESQANYSSRLAAPEPPLSNINNPRHYLYKNLCSLFQRHIVEAVMTANPEVREPKLLVKMCLDND